MFLSAGSVAARVQHYRVSMESARREQAVAHNRNEPGQEHRRLARIQDAPLEDRYCRRFDCTVLYCAKKIIVAPSGVLSCGILCFGVVAWRCLRTNTNFPEIHGLLVHRTRRIERSSTDTSRVWHSEARTTRSTRVLRLLIVSWRCNILRFSSFCYELLSLRGGVRFYCGQTAGKHRSSVV